MTQLEGLKNFVENVKDPMMKLFNSKTPTIKLNHSEAQNIVNFYLEVVDYLSKQKES